MESKYDIIQNSPVVTENDKYYWGYQHKLGRDVIVPYLRDRKAFIEGDKVAEIGCAEGGVLSAFTEAGAVDALGTDIAEFRLKIGENVSSIADFPIEFKYHNIMAEELKPEWKEKYDLVLLRDVIEHLDDTRLALRNIKKLIKPGGFLFVTFPPYHSPYGGHQHTVANGPGKLPYIHLLPNFIFHKMISSGRDNDIGEVKRLQKIRLTSGKFLKAANEEGYSVFGYDYYLLRPVFKMKFGLPTVKLTPISALPLIKSIFSLEASYILKIV